MEHLHNQIVSFCNQIVMEGEPLALCKTLRSPVHKVSPPRMQGDRGAVFADHIGFRYSDLACGQYWLMNSWANTGTQEVDGVEHGGVGEGAAAHHEGDAGDAAEGVAYGVHLPGYGVGVTHEEGSFLGALGVEGGTGGGRPAALAADAGEGGGVGGPEGVGGLLVGVGQEADGVDGHV